MKVTINKNDKCPMCHKNFFDEEGVLVKAAGIYSQEFKSIVHDGCYLPYQKEDDITILFQVRCYSMGDTITTTPILREVKRLYPKSKITVSTWYPDLFAYNPYVHSILDLNGSLNAEMLKQYMFHIDSFNTDKVGHFGTHSMEFAAWCGLNRSLGFENWEYEVNYGDDDKRSMLETVRANGIDPEQDKLIIINPHGTEWPTRDWGRAHFAELAKWLIETYPNHKIVSIGGKRSEVPCQEMKNYVAIDGVVELYGKLKLLESIAFLDHSMSKLMISPDTGTMHLAACARELPIVGIFTLIKAHFRTPVRNHQFGYKFIGIQADDPCNCTYEGKFLTNDRHFRECPKLGFLADTLKLNIPKAIKQQGLINYNPKKQWDFENGLQKQIVDEMKRYQGKGLPCFPTVRKVQIAIMEAMANWN